MSPDANDTRTRILAAALEVFSERGFASATTAEIARRARLAEKTLFAHFKTKDALFEQVVSHSMLALLIPDAGEPLAKLGMEAAHLEGFVATLMKDRLDAYVRHPREFKMVVQELLLRPELARRYIADAAEHVTAPIEKTLKSLQLRGELRAVELARVHRICISVVLGYAISRIILWPDRDWDDDAEIETAAAAVVHGLRRGPGRAGAARAGQPPRVAPPSATAVPSAPRARRAAPRKRPR